MKNELIILYLNIIVYQPMEINMMVNYHLMMDKYKY